MSLQTVRIYALLQSYWGIDGYLIVLYVLFPVSQGAASVRKDPTSPHLSVSGGSKASTSGFIPTAALGDAGWLNRISNS